MRGPMSTVYVVEFSEGYAHVRRRDTNECIGDTSIFAYEIIRALGIEEAVELMKKEANSQERTSATDTKK